jgi:hypothetical protein
MSILKNIKDLLAGKSFLGGFIGGAAEDVLKKLSEGFANKGAETVFKEISKDPSKLISILGSLNEESLQRIASLFNQAISAGRERELTAFLVGAIMPDKIGDPIDKEAAKASLNQLVQGDLKSLNIILEGMSKSSLMHRLGHQLGDLAKIFEKVILETATGISFIIYKADQIAEKKAEELNNDWFGRLAKRLFS